MGYRDGAIWEQDLAFGGDPGGDVCDRVV